MTAPPVLFVGGTGRISWACVRQAVAQGLDVTVLNRELGPRAFAHYDHANPDWPELSARKPGYVFQRRPPRPALHRATAGWYVDEGSYTRQETEEHRGMRKERHVIALQPGNRSAHRWRLDPADRLRNVGA